MIFTETDLQGVYLIDLTPHQDERGFFARSWCQREFREHGLNPNLVQCNISYNKSKGTMRGMHLQLPPFAEAKLVRCTRGSIYDVIIDLRSGSDSYLQWLGVELSASNYKMLYIPEGFAHGFQTLEDDTEVFYQMSEFYSPECSRGLRWNDRAFGIKWPLAVSVISARDDSLPEFDASDFVGVTSDRGTISG
jgi:dTDP-4-dehydrorhamnose 3,5-epimerase